MLQDKQNKLHTHFKETNLILKNTYYEKINHL